MNREQWTSTPLTFHVGVFCNQYFTQCHISQMTSQRAAKPSCIGAQAIRHTAMILFLPSVLSGSKSPSIP